MQADCTIELHRNWYSVPWRLLGETVRIVQQGTRLTVHHGALVVAEHEVASGTRVRRVDPAHLAGISGRALPAVRPGAPAAGPAPRTPNAEAALLRPLAEYAALVEALAGGVAA